MEYKKTRMKSVAERMLDKSLQVLHDATYPFAEQKVYEYNQQSDEPRSPLHLLGVTVEPVEPAHTSDSGVVQETAIAIRGEL